MKRPHRTDRGTAFSHSSIRSSILVEPCFDPLLKISPSAGYSDLPVDYGTNATRARMRACATMCGRPDDPCDVGESRNLDGRHFVFLS
jgi:hypothetical protein